MTDSERLVKLEEAVKLIREVEFSYKEGTKTRSMMYGVMVESFSTGKIGWLMRLLRDRHFDVIGKRKRDPSALEDDPYGGN